MTIEVEPSPTNHVLALYLCVARSAVGEKTLKNLFPSWNSTTCCCRVHTMQSLQFTTTITVVPWRIEIEGFCPAAHLHNCKRNILVDYVANLRHVPSQSELRSLQADGFTWWQQQSFHITTDWIRRLQKYKTKYKELTNLFEAADAARVEEKTAVSCYTGLSLFCSECTLQWQLLIIKIISIGSGAKKMIILYYQEWIFFFFCF